MDCNTESVPMDIPELTEDDNYCTVCKIQCPSEASFRNHLRGLIHTAKVMDAEKAAQEKKTPEDTLEQLEKEYVPAAQKDLTPDDVGKVMFPNEFSCHVCDIKCTSEKSYSDHIKGFKHQKNLKNRAMGVPICNGRGAVRRLQRQATSVPKIQPMINACKDPLLGLQYITEFQKEDPSIECRYVCNMCESKCDPRNLIPHMNGIRHRMAYLKEHYMNYHTLIKQKSEKKSEMTPLLEGYAHQIAAEEGRGQMKVKMELDPFFNPGQQQQQPKRLRDYAGYNEDFGGGSSKKTKKKEKAASSEQTVWASGGQLGAFEVEHVEEEQVTDPGPSENDLPLSFGTNKLKGDKNFGKKPIEVFVPFEPEPGPDLNALPTEFGSSKKSFYDDDTALPTSFGSTKKDNNWGTSDYAKQASKKFGGGRGGGRGGKGGRGGNKSSGLVSAIAEYGISADQQNSYGKKKKNSFTATGYGNYGYNKQGGEDSNYEPLGANKNAGSYGNNMGYENSTATGGYGNNAGGYGNNQGGYSNNQGGFGNNQGGFGNNQGGYGNSSGYGNNTGYGGNNSQASGGYGDNQFGAGGYGNYGNNTAGYRTSNTSNQGAISAAERYGGPINQGTTTGTYPVTAEAPAQAPQKAPTIDPMKAAVGGVAGGPANISHLLKNLSHVVVNNEEEAAMALQVSNALTQALFEYRLKGVPKEMLAQHGLTAPGTSKKAKKKAAAAAATTKSK